MRLNRRNYATAAVIGCQMLSGFFTRHELGKKAIWTLARFAASKTGKVARRSFPGVPLTDPVLTATLDRWS
jgi:hypothetical protein